MKRILVTGGTTFVSKYVAKYFLEHGYEVYVLNRNTKPQIKGIKLIEADRHDIGNELKDIYFDVVADITAYNERDITDLLDALGPYNQYIMLSSSAVYPENNAQPFIENSVLGQNKFWGQYGTDKIAAEKALLDRIPNAYILRPYFSFYNYEYALNVDKQCKILPDTMDFQEGLQEAYNWYIANKNKVVKKPFISYIDQHLRN